MNNPTCAQCDCVAGCQANPKACPNLAPITQPEQPPVRQPLTYAKLIDMLVDVWDSDDETLIRFARAIEEAHGIIKATK